MRDQAGIGIIVDRVGRVGHACREAVDVAAVAPGEVSQL